MNTQSDSRRRLFAFGGLCTLVLAGLALATAGTQDLKAASLWDRLCGGGSNCNSCPQSCGTGGCPTVGCADDVGGTWYWLRSPDEEKRVTMALFNRYCIRCHGVDGRGVWDIPGVPDFTNTVWQGSRTDAELVRIILEGRGAVMPQFRGTLTLEEAWAMARHL